MRVHVVSDVHGNVEALARAGDGADALVVLGDLLDFIDYRDHTRGILGAIFGPEKVGRLAELRKGRWHAETAAYARQLWASLDNPVDVVEQAVHEQYEQLFAAMTVPTYATPGNVDAPELWPKYAGDDVHILDGGVAEIGGLRFGFVGGALLAPGFQMRRLGPWHPYLRTEEEFAAATAELHDVDVLCSHIPPAVAELAYDVIARRHEYGSTSLLEVIRRQKPRWSVFGHVHQPLARRMRIGYTECINVGHFQRSGKPYVLRY